MKKARAISIFLLSALLVSAFTACGGDRGDAPAVTDSVPEDTTPITTEPVDPEANGGRLPLHVDVGDKYAGQDFTFLGIGPEPMYGYYSTLDLVAEESSAEPLQNSIYARNLAISERMGINIKVIEKSDTRAEINRNVQAGDDSYDAVWCWMNHFWTPASSGYFVDFNEIPNIDLDNPWWDQNLRRDFQFYGRNFGMTGDISTKDDGCTVLFCFNKKLITDYDLDSPYELIRSNAWTIDRFTEMIRTVNDDVNGDDKRTDGDLFGFYSESGSVNRFFLSAGGSFYEKKADDTYEINVTSERNMAIYDAIFNAILDPTAVTNIEQWKNSGPNGNVY